MGLLDLKEWKCKTCGEPLDIAKAVGGVIKCGVCDSCFTLPKTTTSDKVISLLFQGEHELDTGRFDEAYSAFNKAAELDKTEPEAYWGMALAEFKIQYLKDEGTEEGKPRLQPICHEINDKNFTDSPNFLKAVRYATEAQRAEYERKGAEINYIKNEFFKIAQSGVKYDCFICVKVNDENGGRTADCKTADDIYFELKGKGYKPFFSERELGGVTGADYEARILYALYSAECMLVVCFNDGYLRTKWVKNEYTRFLKLVNDEEKESDSIALVFGKKPIEKLPNRQGKLQGIAANSMTAMERIVLFVDGHTPEAKRRREEEQRRKAEEDEALRRQLAEQNEIIRKLQEQMQNQPQQTQQSLSDEELFERFECARKERERKEREEAERKAAEERTRKEREEQARKDREEAERKVAEEQARIGRDFEIENGVLKKYKGSDSEVVIPDGVKSIGSKAFKGQKTLTSITIPSSVKRICKDAFANCRKFINIFYNGDITTWCSIVGLENLMSHDACSCKKSVYFSGKN